jgi:sugar/nucleoside kinase (ribokinase family)
MAILSFLGWETYPISRLKDDPAARYLRHDLAQWGVHDDFLSIDTEVDTPVIVQQILRTKVGGTSHKFSWQCPSCGRYLPSFRPPTIRAVRSFIERLADHTVYFFDRVSAATVLLAEQCSNAGALIFFEPNSGAPEHLLKRALRVAHIVKYSANRVKGLPLGNRTILEIRTLGEDGLEFRRDRDRRWTKMSAIKPAELKDTCGSGDWCSAGLMYKLGESPLGRLTEFSNTDLADALRFGQALASWNCAFEGARGGMYHVNSPSAVIREATALLEGRRPAIQSRSTDLVRFNDFSQQCKACFAPYGRSKSALARANAP